MYLRSSQNPLGGINVVKIQKAPHVFATVLQMEGIIIAPL